MAVRLLRLAAYFGDRFSPTPENALSGDGGIFRKLVEDRPLGAKRRVDGGKRLFRSWCAHWPASKHEHEPNRVRSGVPFILGAEKGISLTAR